MTSFSVISMTMRSGATWARSRKSMRGFPRNCGSRMVAGSALTKIRAFEGTRPEERRARRRQSRASPTSRVWSRAAPKSASAVPRRDPRGPPEEHVGRQEVRQRERDVAPPLALQEEDEPQAPRPIQAQDVARPVVLTLVLLEDLEDALPHLLVGVDAVLVLDHRQGAQVQHEDAEAGRLAELLDQIRQAVVVGGDGLGHGREGGRAVSPGPGRAQMPG